MKTIAASLVALSLFAGVANARPASQIFVDIQKTAPRSIFDDIQASAPRSLFDQIQDSAPLSSDSTGSIRQDHAGE